MIKFFFLLYITLILLVSCSNDEGENPQLQNNQSHILKSQKQAIDKAKAVEQLLQNGVDNRRQIIQEQTK